MKEMQITLTQADIETAILTHLNTKLKFEEGFTPSIELKATRGPEGFTAIIDLDDDKSTGKAPRQTRQKVEKPADPPAAPEAESDKAESVKQTTAPETAQEAAEVLADEEATAVPDNTSTAEQAADAAESGQPETTDATAEEEEEVSAGEKPRSIFAGLSKPRNPA